MHKEKLGKVTISAIYVERLKSYSRNVTCRSGRPLPAPGRAIGKYKFERLNTWCAQYLDEHRVWLFCCIWHVVHFLNPLHIMCMWLTNNCMACLCNLCKIALSQPSLSNSKKSKKCLRSWCSQLKLPLLCSGNLFTFLADLEQFSPNFPRFLQAMCFLSTYVY